MDIIIIDERPSVVGNSFDMTPNKTWYAGGAQGSVERLHREKSRGWVETCKMKFPNPKKQTPKISISSISLGISGSPHSIISQPLAPSFLEGVYLSQGFVSSMCRCLCIHRAVSKYQSIRVSKNMKDDWTKGIYPSKKTKHYLTICHIL